MQVITVPAHFTEQQRAATAEAGSLAGLQRLRLLQGEPHFTIAGLNLCMHTHTAREDA